MGTTVEFYKDVTRGRFSTTAEPTIEGTTGTDSINRAVADGGQVPDIFDGDRLGLLTAIASTGLVLGDDSTFASDTGTWDTSDSSVFIDGTSLVFGTAPDGNGAFITALVKANVSYYLTFSI